MNYDRIRHSQQQMICVEAYFRHLYTRPMKYKWKNYLDQSKPIGFPVVVDWYNFLKSRIE
jgi:hypothetical protein